MKIEISIVDLSEFKKNHCEGAIFLFFAISFETQNKKKLSSCSIFLLLIQEKEKKVLEQQNMFGTSAENYCSGKVSGDDRHFKPTICKWLSIQRIIVTFT